MAGKNKELGNYIKEKRVEKGYSIREVERKTSISNAYLGQIERGDVKEPSPKKLMALSECLGISYDRLMTLAGYVVPQQNTGERIASSNTHSLILSDEQVTEEEAKALREFLKTLRSFKD